MSERTRGGDEGLSVSVCWQEGLFVFVSVCGFVFGERETERERERERGRKRAICADHASHLLV